MCMHVSNRHQVDPLSLLRHTCNLWTPSRSGIHIGMKLFIHLGAGLAHSASTMVYTILLLFVVLCSGSGNPTRTCQELGCKTGLFHPIELIGRPLWTWPHCFRFFFQWWVSITLIRHVQVIGHKKWGTTLDSVQVHLCLPDSSAAVPASLVGTRRGSWLRAGNKKNLSFGKGSTW